MWRAPVLFARTLTSPSSGRAFVCASPRPPLSVIHPSRASQLHDYPLVKLTSLSGDAPLVAPSIAVVESCAVAELVAVRAAAVELVAVRAAAAEVEAEAEAEAAVDADAGVAALRCDIAVARKEGIRYAAAAVAAAAAVIRAIAAENARELVVTLHSDQAKVVRMVEDAIVVADDPGAAVRGAVVELAAVHAAEAELVAVRAAAAGAAVAAEAVAVALRCDIEVVRKEGIRCAAAVVVAAVAATRAIAADNAKELVVALCSAQATVVRMEAVAVAVADETDAAVRGVLAELDSVRAAAAVAAVDAEAGAAALLCEIEVARQQGVRRAEAEVAAVDMVCGTAVEEDHALLVTALHSSLASRVSRLDAGSVVAADDMGAEVSAAAAMRSGIDGTRRSLTDMMAFLDSLPHSPLSPPVSVDESTNAPENATEDDDVTCDVPCTDMHDLAHVEDHAAVRGRVSKLNSTKRTMRVGGAPKRPATSFLLFMADNRVAINMSLAEAGMVVDMRETSKAGSVMWRNLSPADKEPFIARASVLHSNWVVQKADYVATKSDEPEDDIVAPKKPRRNPAEPRRPASPFVLFLNENRVSIKAFLGEAGASFVEVGRRGAVLWTELTPEGRAVFTDKFYVRNELYKIAMTAFVASDGAAA